MLSNAALGMQSLRVRGAGGGTEATEVTEHTQYVRRNGVGPPADPAHKRSTGCRIRAPAPGGLILH